MTDFTWFITTCYDRFYMVYQDVPWLILYGLSGRVMTDFTWFITTCHDWFYMVYQDVSWLILHGLSGRVMTDFTWFIRTWHDWFYMVYQDVSWLILYGLSWRVMTDFTWFIRTCYDWFLPSLSGRVMIYFYMVYQDVLLLDTCQSLMFLPWVSFHELEESCTSFYNRPLIIWVLCELGETIYCLLSFI